MEKLFESAFVILVVNAYWKRKFQKNNTRDKEKTIPILQFSTTFDDGPFFEWTNLPPIAATMAVKVITNANAPFDWWGRVKCLSGPPTFHSAAFLSRGYFRAGRLIRLPSPLLSPGRLVTQARHP